MTRTIPAARLALMTLALASLSAPEARASFLDFSSWSLVQDPSHPRLSASAGGSVATLLASGGPIPSGTDIGYASVNGETPAASSSGFAFDPSASVSLAIDFLLSTSGTPDGSLALGFGIGEDRSGANSAGVILVTNDGAPVAFAGAARIGDVTQAPGPIAVLPSLSGSLFVSYDASSGDILLGVSTTPGAAGPSASTTFSGLQRQWSGGLLLASFFLRSDALPGGPWQSGDAEATFSNLRIRDGAPVSVASVVPEPGSLALASIGAAAVLLRLRSVRRLLPN